MLRHLADFSRPMRRKSQHTLKWTFFTLPDRGAVNEFCIFMASTTATSCPSTTMSPSLMFRETSLPGMGVGTTSSRLRTFFGGNSEKQLRGGKTRACAGEVAMAGSEGRRKSV